MPLALFHTPLTAGLEKHLGSDVTVVSCVSRVALTTTDSSTFHPAHTQPEPVQLTEQR